MSFGYTRESQDAVVVQQKMPSNTRTINSGGVTGYTYKITCQLGNIYTFFAYFDGSCYQVMLVDPNYAGVYNQHDSHLFSDGRLCLGAGAGMPTLESAYAKSVIWATGFSCYLQVGNFQFSNNN